MRLTDALITRERYRGEPFTDEGGRTQWPPCVLWDDELSGFGVRIHPPVRGRPSRKDFIVTWRSGLKSRTMALGTYGVDCTLRQARRAAREALDLARRGRDPIEARQVALGIGTAEDLASRFLFEHTAAQKKATSDTEARGAAEGGAPGEGADEAASVVEPEGAAAATLGGGAEVPGATVGPAIEAAASCAPTPGAAVVDGGSVGAGSPVAAGAPVTADPPAAEGAPASPVAAGDTAAVGSAAGSAPGVDGAAQLDGGSPDSAPPRIESPPRPSRGPTKMRLWSVPDALYRDLERRARAAGLSMTGYLRALIERDTIAPHVEDVLRQVEARQTVEVASAAGEPHGEEPGRRRQ